MLTRTKISVSQPGILTPNDHLYLIEKQVKTQGLNRSFWESAQDINDKMWSIRRIKWILEVKIAKYYESLSKQNIESRKISLEPIASERLLISFIGYLLTPYFDFCNDFAVSLQDDKSLKACSLIEEGKLGSLALSSYCLHWE